MRDSRTALAESPNMDHMSKYERKFYMTMLQLPDRAEADPVPREINAASRRRVSGPSLRTFLAIADLYDIPTRDRVVLLGEPANSTYHAWVRKARAEASLGLSLDTLTRISGILGIYKALGILFPIEAEAMTWLKGPHRGEVFGGQAPIDVMIEGGLDGILTVRRYLDAWRDGLRGGPGEVADVDPVRKTDLVFT